MIRVSLIVAFLLVSEQASASCASRDEHAQRFSGSPKFVITSCESAEIFLAKNVRFHELLSNNADFREYVSRVGIDPESSAITVTPYNSAGLAFMFSKKKSTWLFKGQCANVPLSTPVEFETLQGCSDTGPLIGTFFDDLLVMKIIRQ